MEMPIRAYAELVKPDEQGAWQCMACQWRCSLSPGESGFCHVRTADGEGIHLDTHTLMSAASVEPIEHQHLWHFFPGSQAMTIGGWGYAFPTDQAHGPYAKLPSDTSKLYSIEAERVATTALNRLCRGVVWTYSDPAVSYEYVREVLQYSRAASRYTAIVTSGWLTPEALDGLLPYTDGICLDLRGFRDSSYERLGGVSAWQGILDIAVAAHKQCHIEITTRIHHGVNDDTEELRALTHWIGKELGPQTPWHVLPGDAGAATAASVGRARRIGTEQGLVFVYGAEPEQATLCPGCGEMLISRERNTVRLSQYDQGACMICHTPITMRTSLFRRT